MNAKNITTPKLSLPKGGGASSGIGETFQPSAFSGTGSYSIPIPLTSARGFEPHLSIDYNSGSGNGIFGLGFALSIPKISIRTERGTPKYDGTDTFTAGTCELVPKIGSSYERDGFDVFEYLPRVEGSFSIIKHFINKDKTESYWEITTNQNETSFFGKSNETRIYNPSDNDKTQIFEWLIEESIDSKGNKIAYSYKKEDNENLLNKDWEKGRSYNNKYIQSIKYGNYFDEKKLEQFDFEVVFDYGEYTLPTSDVPTLSFGRKWDYRSDPFSSFKSGFEIRTCRLCKNILVFHHFKNELGDPTLVKAITLNYGPHENYGDIKTIGPSIMESVVLTGSRRNGEKSADTYTLQSLPPLKFGFSKFNAPKNPEFKKLQIDKNSIPGYLDGSGFMPVDLKGEGISGFLYSDSNSLMYLEPEGNGKYSTPEPPESFPINRDFKNCSASLVDLEGNGELELVINNQSQSGYYQRGNGDSWGEYQTFRTYPTDFANPDMELVGLSSNGKTDLMLADQNDLIVYPSIGIEGYSISDRIEKKQDFPSIKKGYREEHVGFGNLLGDGLSHRIKITNGSVECWPNLGYGKFGKKIILGNAPNFDHKFDTSRLHLADINGSGTLDIVYIYQNRIELFLNESGNSFSDAITVTLPEPYSNIDRVSFSDILGNGTTCLVFTKMAPVPTHYYYDFTGEITIDGKSHKSFKPYLLYQIDNNRGAVTQIQYCSSTKFYLEDKKAGNPWITKLPFPVQLVEKTISIDKITGSRFTHCFKYHDGFYDHVEREFRGFGYVESWDTEKYEDLPEGIINKENYVPPVYTKTWFHTGLPIEKGIVEKHYKKKFFNGDTQAYEFPHSHPDLFIDVEKADSETIRQAHATLHGHVMRTEIFAMDNNGKEGNPYTVTESNVKVSLFQDKADNKFAVFMVNNRESISYHYERNPEDPRIEQDFTLETDTYGNVLQSCKIFLPRRLDKDSKNPIYPEQQILKAVLELHTYVQPLESDLFCHVACEEQTFEISGLKCTKDYFSIDDLKDKNGLIVQEGLKKQLEPIGLPERKNILPYKGESTLGVQIRQLTWNRHYFWNAEQKGCGNLGSISSPAILHHSEEAVFSQKQIEAVYGNKLTDEIHLNHYEDEKRGNQIGGGYDYKDGYWWNPGLTQHYALKDKFYLPNKITDPFDNITEITYDTSYLVNPIKSKDALGNITESEIDYHTLKSWRITDINGNKSEALFDALSMVVATSTYKQNENKLLEGDKPLDSHILCPGIQAEDVLTYTNNLLQEATSYFYYEHRFIDGKPPHSISLMRETHVCDLKKDTKSNIQVHISYSDGFGRALQTKVHSAKADDNAKNQWLTSGRTVYNNKGKPVKQYEPFYSSDCGYEANPEINEHGVTHITHYDPLLRIVKVTNPDESFTKVEFTPWEEKHYDENDTDDKSDFHETPDIHILDNQGRPFQVIQQLENGDQLITRHELDIQGRELSNTDPSGVCCFKHTYDMAGAVLQTQSADAGTHWTLHNVMGHPIHSWDSRKFHTKTIYDKFHRPVEVHVKEDDGKGLKLDNIVERMIYGEAIPNPEIRNLRGKLVQHYDQAGLVEFDSYDIKGEPLKSTRCLRKKYREEPNWIEGEEGDLLESVQKDLKTEFVTEWTHDALGRVIQEVHPDGSISNSQYHAEGWLRKLDVVLGESIKDQSPPSITHISYNAKGQRTSILYGNSITTEYIYDKKRFRLINLKTTAAENTGKRLQDIHYTYDLVGNITTISDNAQQTNYFNGQIISPISTYTYDALYRLKSATGREHIGQALKPESSWDDKFRSQLPLPTDGPAMREYKETYVYDASGNIKEISHWAVNGNWTRNFTYNEASLINSTENSNRLSSSQLEQNKSRTTPYQYDAHGNMGSMPHLSLMKWDHRDQLQATSQQYVDSGTPETTWYVYDADGHRVRQVTDAYAESGNEPVKKKERIYLGGFEIYRKYDDGKVKLERETLHIMDDKKRMAMVETKIRENGKKIDTTTLLTRYQLSNHLDSASLELDDLAQIISYEEYTPFGSTSYQAVRKDCGAPKRYRYSGKERDDATGLYYYGFRYYAPWLGRWMNPDPAGTVDGLNLYAFVGNNPIKFSDHHGLNRENKVAPTPAQMPAVSLAGYLHAASDQVVLALENNPATVEETKTTAATAVQTSTGITTFVANSIGLIAPTIGSAIGGITAFAGALRSGAQHKNAKERLSNIMKLEDSFEKNESFEKFNKIVQYTKSKTKTRVNRSARTTVLSGLAVQGSAAAVAGGALFAPLALPGTAVAIGAGAAGAVHSGAYTMKGIYKSVINTRGKNREKHATELYDLAVKDDPNALALLEAMHVTGTKERAITINVTSKKESIKRIMQKMRS